MTQHDLLAIVVPPLLLVGAPRGRSGERSRCRPGAHITRLGAAAALAFIAVTAYIATMH